MNRFYYVLGAVSVLLSGFLMAATAAWADTFTVFDLHDTLSITTDGSQSRIGTIFSCSSLPNPPVESLTCFTINLPPGATTATGGDFSKLGAIGEGNGKISDVFFIAGGGPTDIEFASDTPNSGVPGVTGDCSQGFQFENVVLSGCPITENGMVQSIGTITWDNGVVDTLKFQSDLDAVPEPSSILLLLTGFVGVYAARRFRFFVHPA